MDNHTEIRSTRNVVIKLRLRQAESSIQKWKRKITRIDDIVATLKKEMERRQISENHLLNDLAESTDCKIKEFDLKKGKINAHIAEKEERKAYLLQLDSLSVKDRFVVYKSHLSNFINNHNIELALVFLSIGIFSGGLLMAAELFFIPLLVLSVASFVIAILLFLL